MPTELSPRSPRLATLRELQTPRGRRESRRFAVEGPMLLDEAARSGLRPRELYLTPEAGSETTAHWEAGGVPVYVVAEHVLARASDLETPTGLIAVFDLPERSVEEVLRRAGPVLLLAGVNDPGNAGTLVRSAEAFGAAGVLFGRGGADPYSPKVVRAAMGSLFRLPVATVDADAVLAAARAAERPVVITDVRGESLQRTHVPGNAVLAVGNERRGARDWLPRWDLAVRIPQRGATESLNAAVAGSIALYELTRCQDPCQDAENP